MIARQRPFFKARAPPSSPCLRANTNFPYCFSQGDMIMDDTVRHSPSDRRPMDRLTDGLDLWDSETVDAPTGLAPIRLDSSERLLIPFTTSLVRTELHYLDSQEVRGYVACNGT